MWIDILSKHGAVMCMVNIDIGPQELIEKLDGEPLINWDGLSVAQARRKARIALAALTITYPDIHSISSGTHQENFNYLDYYHTDIFLRKLIDGCSENLGCKLRIIGQCRSPA